MTLYGSRYFSINTVYTFWKWTHANTLQMVGTAVSLGEIIVQQIYKRIFERRVYRRPQIIGEIIHRRTSEGATDNIIVRKQSKRQYRHSALSPLQSHCSLALLTGLCVFLIRRWISLSYSANVLIISVEGIAPVFSAAVVAEAAAAIGRGCSHAITAIAPSPLMSNPSVCI